MHSFAPTIAGDAAAGLATASGSRPAPNQLQVSAALSSAESSPALRRQLRHGAGIAAGRSFIPKPCGANRRLDFTLAHEKPEQFARHAHFQHIEVLSKCPRPMVQELSGKHLTNGQKRIARRSKND